jgi:hypothetical protein
MRIEIFAALESVKGVVTAGCSAIKLEVGCPDARIKYENGHTRAIIVSGVAVIEWKGLFVYSVQVPWRILLRKLSLDFFVLHDGE